jgi:CHAD domain-containing protein
VSARDPEGVHQMRVGLRRLRAAISIFSDLIDDAQTAAVKAELKWLTNELGPARDIDVYVTGNIKPLQDSLPPQRGLEKLQHELEARRADAFERAKKAVESARYRTLMLDLLGWIIDGEWCNTGDELVRVRRARPAADFAREELARRVRKVSKRAKKLAKLEPRKRHKLRIAGKKLRYAIGFFGSLFVGRKAERRLRRFVRDLKQLQNCLGALNDIAVHRRLASNVAGPSGRRRERAFAIGVVSGREQSRQGPLQDAALAAAGGFAAARPFWR